MKSLNRFSYTETRSCYSFLVLYFHGHIQPYCDICSTLCNSCIFRTLPYSESWYIQNPGYIQNSVKVYFGVFRTLCKARILRTCNIQSFAIFRILTYLRLKAYSETCQTSKMHGLTKLVKGYNCTSKTFHLSCLTTLYSDLGLYIKSGILRTLAYSESCLYISIFRHMQTYSIIIVIITLTFFFHLHTSQRNLKRYIF